jgi:DNA adenine methylase
MPGIRHPFTSPLRYPGGKGMLANFMKLVLSQNGLLDGHYVEVYAGGASIAWSLLFEEYVRHVHINDIDPAVYAFWGAVFHNTDAICRLIHDTPVNMRIWRRQHQVLHQPSRHSPLELAFAAFFLNRTNHSGIIRGGVIGGKAQAGTWKLDARFNKRDLTSRILHIARYAPRISLYNLDAMDLLQTIVPTLPSRSLLYLDPPYYTRGKDLYEHHYSHADHVAISMALASMPSRPWIVTYDSVPQVIRLYRGYRRIRYDLAYSAQGRYFGDEVMFFSKALLAPRVLHPARVPRGDVHHLDASRPCRERSRG